MDGSSANKSSLSLDKRESFQEIVFRKFKFLRTFKNYVLSKIRTGKYELGSGAENEISIISYDQRSFADAEREFDLQTKSVNIDADVVELLKKALDRHFGDVSHRPPDLELLEVIEKTFARQLDIFEGILKLINSNYRSDVNEECSRRLNATSDQTVDGFINDIVRNLVTELTKNAQKSFPQIEDDHLANECKQASSSGAVARSDI